MTEEQILISEIHGIRNGFKWGYEVRSESIERIFDKMEEWLKKEHVPTEIKGAYRIETFEPKRSPLPGEKEMPVYSVCYHCRMPIFFRKLTNEDFEKEKYNKVFDSVAEYEDISIYHVSELNGENAWARHHRPGSDGDRDRIILCPNCKQLLDEFMKRR